MHKQAMLDAFPHVFSDDELNDIVDKKMNNSEPYEEKLLYLRGAYAIHEYLIKHLAGGVDNFDFGPYEVPISLINLINLTNLINPSSAWNSYALGGFVYLYLLIYQQRKG